MRLKEYIDTFCINPSDLAESCGVTEQAISQYKLGKRRPRPEIAQAIVRNTRGKVTLEDLIFIETESPSPRTQHGR